MNSSKAMQPALHGSVTVDIAPPMASAVGLDDDLGYHHH